MSAENGNCLGEAFAKACEVLLAADWRGLEAEIARTGEEDPLAMVDDPGMAAVIAAKMALRRSQEAHMLRGLDEAEQKTAAALFEIETKYSAATGDQMKLFEAVAALAQPILAIAGKIATNGSERHDDRLARLFLLSKYCDLAEPFISQPS